MQAGSAVQAAMSLASSRGSRGQFDLSFGPCVCDRAVMHLLCQRLTWATGALSSWCPALVAQTLNLAAAALCSVDCTADCVRAPLVVQCCPCGTALQPRRLTAARACPCCAAAARAAVANDSATAKQVDIAAKMREGLENGRETAGECRQAALCRRRCPWPAVEAAGGSLRLKLRALCL